MATWKRLTRDAPEGPIDVNMEKVALIEREKNRSYTLLIFNFAREDSLYTMTVKERMKYTALRHCQRGELFPTGGAALMNCRKRGVRNLRLGHRWVGLGGTCLAN